MFQILLFVKFKIEQFSSGLLSCLVKASMGFMVMGLILISLNHCCGHFGCMFWFIVLLEKSNPNPVVAFCQRRSYFHLKSPGTRKKVPLCLQRKNSPYISDPPPYLPVSIRMYLFIVFNNNYSIYSFQSACLSLFLFHWTIKSSSLKFQQRLLNSGCFHLWFYDFLLARFPTVVCCPCRWCVFVDLEAWLAQNAALFCKSPLETMGEFCLLSRVV